MPANVIDPAHSERSIRGRETAYRRFGELLGTDIGPAQEAQVQAMRLQQQQRGRPGRRDMGDNRIDWFNEAWASTLHDPDHLELESYGFVPDLDTLEYQPTHRIRAERLG